MPSGDWVQSPPPLMRAPATTGVFACRGDRALVARIRALSRRRILRPCPPRRAKAVAPGSSARPGCRQSDKANKCIAYRPHSRLCPGLPASSPSRRASSWPPPRLSKLAGRTAEKPRRGASSSAAPASAPISGLSESCAARPAAFAGSAASPGTPAGFGVHAGDEGCMAQLACREFRGTRVPAVFKEVRVLPGRAALPAQRALPGRLVRKDRPERPDPTVQPDRPDRPASLEM
jgi:hypothetical protein